MGDAGAGEERGGGAAVGEVWRRASCGRGRRGGGAAVGELLRAGGDAGAGECGGGTAAGGGGAAAGDPAMAVAAVAPGEVRWRGRRGRCGGALAGRPVGCGIEMGV